MSNERLIKLILSIAFGVVVFLFELFSNIFNKIFGLGLTEEEEAIAYLNLRIRKSIKKTLSNSSRASTYRVSEVVRNHRNLKLSSDTEIKICINNLEREGFIKLIYSGLGSDEIVKGERFNEM